MLNRTLQQIFDETIAWKPEGEPSEVFMLVHQIGISVCWSLLSSFIIMYSMYQYRKYAFYIHAIIGSIIVIYTLSMIFPILIVYSLKFGLGDFNIFIVIGAWIGLAVVILSFLLVISGVYSRVIQERKQQKSSKILLSKRVHKVIGYIITYLAKLNVLLGWYPKKIWLFFLAWQICFLFLLIFRKRMFPKLEDTVVSQHTQKLDIVKDPIPIISGLEELHKLKKKFVIFSDYVYDVTPLEIHHPAGYEIVKAVEGRQIDRFIYGMYSAQLLPQIPIYSHSYKSMELVGKPIAKISIPSPYPSTPQVFDVLVKGRQIVSAKGGIHVLWLQAIDSEISLQFRGYTNVNQLGQYFALNMNQNTTRLYTSVNFLTSLNVKLMKQILINEPSIKKYYSEENQNIVYYQYNYHEKDKQNNPEKQQRIETSQSVSSERGIKYQTNTLNQYLPLMIKKYQHGKLTPFLLNNHFSGNLRLSSPKGLGLDFGNLNPGKIIIVAGGTGLYPFMDLIDLLYKRQLLAENNQFGNKILQQNPILINDPFVGFNFVLYAAFHQPQDIHPVTMHQLSYISQQQTHFKTILRFKERSEEVKQWHKHLTLITNRFDKNVIEEAKKEKFQKIWICGPPILNTQISQSLINNGFAQHQYLLI